jgi:hypothetical protein
VPRPSPRPPRNNCELVALRLRSSINATRIAWPACLQTPQWGTQSFRTAPVSAHVSWHSSHGLKCLVFEGITVWSFFCYTCRLPRVRCTLAPPSFIGLLCCSCFLASSYVQKHSAETPRVSCPQCRLSDHNAISRALRQPLLPNAAIAALTSAASAAAVHPLQPTYTSPCRPLAMQLVSHIRLL